MAKLHFVKKARKAIPEAGVEVGDSYYFFKKRVNGKGTPRVCSKIKPRRSAYATSSPFLGALMDYEDELNGMLARNASAEGVATWLENVVSEVEAMGDSCREKSQSVESGMKNGAGTTSAEMLISRADHCSDLASAIREAINELELGDRAGVDDNQDEDGNWTEGEPPIASVAEVVANIVWLP